MELKMMFYLSNVAIAVNISQPSVRIGGGLHALIHIFFLHGGSKSAKPYWDLKRRYPTDRRLGILADRVWRVVRGSKYSKTSGQRLWYPNDVDGAVNVRPPFHQWLAFNWLFNEKMTVAVVRYFSSNTSIRCSDASDYRKAGWRSFGRVVTRERGWYRCEQ